MNWSAFLSYVFMTAMTPGPNIITSMANTARYGLKNSIHFNYGVFAGFTAVCTLCALFTSVLYSSIPSIEPFMRVLGSAYILWMAWVIWRDKPKGAKKSLFSNTTTFSSGFLLQFLNVKTILYGLTNMATFILPNFSNVFIIGLLIIFMAFMGFMGGIVWSLGSSALKPFFNNHHKLINGIMALLMVYCAVSMIAGIF